MATKTAGQKLTEREAKLRKQLAQIETRRKIAVLREELKKK
jgi:hypothetical protein